MGSGADLDPDDLFTDKRLKLRKSARWHFLSFRFIASTTA